MLDWPIEEAELLLVVAAAVAVELEEAEPELGTAVTEADPAADGEEELPDAVVAVAEAGGEEEAEEALVAPVAVTLPGRLNETPTDEQIASASPMAVPWSDAGQDEIMQLYTESTKSELAQRQA